MKSMLLAYNPSAINLSDIDQEHDKSGDLSWFLQATLELVTLQLL